ncbi:MAG: peptide deformylase [Gammaproteobacteria bacterium]|jgi:peptide deformylase|nr:peptide deformylase [Gammaproteobacteria bacterium]|tara:strand:+ start:679 stop:1182 length:504 start_codon:yes stop_codon:yes gene_type:complete
MVPLEILEFPDPRLRTTAKPVKEIDGKLNKLIDRMLDTMYEAPGIGLAATQLNIHQRLVVLDISQNKDSPLILINPVLASQEGELETDEGCLSVPGFYEAVTRASHIHVKALSRDGDPISIEAEDLLAVCIQHEIDHLDGKLFVDYLSAAKRQMIRKKLLKLQRQQA